MVVDLKYVVDTLSNYYNVRDEDFVAYYLCRRGYNPFEVLVAIVLSQNTRDELALKAFNNLRALLGELTPNKFLECERRVIEDAIRIAGLYRRRYKTLVGLSKELKQLRSLDELLTIPPETLKKLLLDIDGVGYKTVDVFLLMCRSEAVFPIDTHIKRVLTRLGIAKAGDDYLSIQSKVHKLLPPTYYLRTHLILITHGRSCCKARKPLCSKCVISNICPKIY